MHAVLTGDIVGSSALTPEEHRKVVGIVKSVASAFPEIVVGTVDVFSGDSWQMLLNNCGESFKIALYLRASLKRKKAFSIDSRISVVWGDVDLNQVNPSRISESTGETFTASGRGLARLKKPALMCFSARSDPRLSLAVDGMVRLMDALVRQWSPEQARAIAETLLGKTQQEIAEEFDVGQSSINKSLQTALWPDVDYAIGRLGELAKNHPFG
jgi:hypothetical protein